VRDHAARGRHHRVRAGDQVHAGVEGGGR
jgi:hypothetical protein